jgi:choline-sulfatase
MTARPDLVLFMTDQQRFDQVGYASDGHFETPHLDRLAERGVIFENAYSASTTCVPARVALLTGLQPHRVPTQVTRFALREGFWTVARALAAAGYETALMGKMHFAPVHADHGFATMRLCEHLGQVQARGGSLDDMDECHHWLKARGVDDWRLQTANGEQPSRGTFPHAAEFHPTDWIADETISFLERRDRDRPLFLVVSFMHPHAPHNPPEPYASMYAPDESRLPMTGFEVNDELPEVFRKAMTQFGKRTPLRVDPSNLQPLRTSLATIRGLVKQIDDAMGGIVTRLDLERTVVFFTSDHGDYAGHRGLLRKMPWIPFDDLARVPLMVAGGDVCGGRRIQSLVQSCDFPLTCLEYAGVDAPAHIDFDSRSLGEILRDRPDAAGDDRAVFSATTMGWPMVRHGTHKYIVHRGSNTGVLFDLTRDPDERFDLQNDGEYRAVAEDLSVRLTHELSRGVVQSQIDR